MVLPIRPIPVIRHRHVPRGLRDIPRLVPGRLVRVLDRVRRIHGPDLQISLLDQRELRRLPEREHSRDGARGPLGARVHADRDVPVPERDGLDLGRGLEGVVAHRPHHHVRLGRGAPVLVPVEVDVVRGVHHQHRGVASRDVGAAVHQQAVVPVLDRPYARPRRVVEVVVRHGRGGRALRVVDGFWDAHVLRHVPEIEEAVVGEVVRCRRVGSVAVTS